MTITTLPNYFDAVERALAAAEAYHDEAEPLMSDGEFDDLLVEIRDFESTNPDQAISHGLFDTVGSGGSKGGDVPHDVPMLSLEKTKLIEDVEAFLAKAAALGSRVELQPKHDGMAIDVRYEDGVLVRAATRGDGKSGKDLTARVLNSDVNYLPRIIEDDGTFNVRGELIMTTSDFAYSDANRVAAGKDHFANPRNATSGSIQSSSLEYDVRYTFVVYDITGVLETVEAQRNAGFLPIVDTLPEGMSTDATIDTVAQFGVECYLPSYPYSTDGAVLKMMDMDARAEVGATSSVPRWALAFKYPDPRVQTYLRGIEVGVGRTGNISYTAHFDRVYVDGSFISKASLHNPSQIAEKDIRIGDAIMVYKANRIIPQVDFPIVELRGDDVLPYEASTLCPVSGTPLDMTGEIWRSTDPSVSIGALINYAGGRDALDIDGLGIKIAVALVDGDEPLVNDLADLFTLDRERLVALSVGENAKGNILRLGEKSADKLLAEIEKAKTQPFNRVITALGVRKTGRTMGIRIADHFGNMDSILAASEQDFHAIEAVKGGRSAYFYEGFQQLRPVIERLAAAGVTMEVEAVEDDGSVKVLVTDDGKPMKVAVSGGMTGVLSTLSQGEVKELVAKHGGAVTGSVSARTHLLVCGEEGSTKWKDAKKHGVRILTPEDFADLIGHN